MNFFLDLESFAKKTQIKLDLVVRKVVIDMTSSIVPMTPVLNGFARNNYFWGFLRVASINATPDKTGAASISRAAAFAADLRAGGTVYLTNNLPYIMPLEFGHSKQAPAGMARITVARFQGVVNKIVAGLR